MEGLGFVSFYGGPDDFAAGVVGDFDFVFPEAELLEGCAALADFAAAAEEVVGVEVGGDGSGRGVENVGSGRIL